MSSKGTYKPTGPFAPQYIQGVYIPSAILIVGAALVKRLLVPLAVVIAAGLAAYQFYNQRKSCTAGKLLFHSKSAVSI